MFACWVEDPYGDSFKKHLARLPDYIWIAEDGIKMQVRSNNFFLFRIYFVFDIELHSMSIFIEICRPLVVSCGTPVLPFRR